MTHIRGFRKLLPIVLMALTSVSLALFSATAFSETNAEWLMEGYFLAFDAATGKMLSKKKTDGPIGGGIITYSINGKQYVAVAAGMNNAIMGTKSGPASVVIYALPDKGGKQKHR